MSCSAFHCYASISLGCFSLLASKTNFKLLKLHVFSKERVFFLISVSGINKVGKRKIIYFIELQTKYKRISSSFLNEAISGVIPNNFFKPREYKSLYSARMWTQVSLCISLPRAPSTRVIHHLVEAARELNRYFGGSNFTLDTTHH